MSAGDQRLLGRLAELAWFTRNGEVAATRSIGMLLEDSALRASTLEFVSRRAGVDLTNVERFIAESVHEDRGRPDLEGLDADGRPLLVVEAKFSAALTVDQLIAYATDQGNRLLGVSTKEHAGVLALLVPETRRAEAHHKVTHAVRQVSATYPDLHPVSSLVLSWDEWLGQWDQATTHLTAADSLAGDVAQLHAMCMSLGGLYVAPFGRAAIGSDWRTREEQFRVIVDEVTQKLSTPGVALAPMRDETNFAARRYFAVDSIPGSYGAIGIQTDFADAGEPPIWLRFHGLTPEFARINETIQSSPFRGLARQDDGHLWIPLEVPPDLGGVELVAHLEAQARSILDHLG